MTPHARTPTAAVALCLLLPFAAAHGAPVGKHPAPNLTPLAPSAAPLLRKISAGSAAMIPSFYCVRVPADRELDVDVPAFDWGVANDRGAPVDRAFSVAVLNAASDNALPLVTEIVQKMPESGTRVFRNWPGRPTRVRVINVTAANPKLGSEYDNAPGCYIPTALLGSVRLDPKSVIVRVDSGAQIPERLENDNDLTR